MRAMQPFPRLIVRRTSRLAFVLIAGVGLAARSAAGDGPKPATGSAVVPRDPPAVRLGVDVLIAEDFKPLAGKRVGLITNPTGVTGSLQSTIDVLHNAKGVKLVALFGPEHGVRGAAAAGAEVEDATDPATGVPAYSLYGKHHKPTPEMLKSVDVLVFDIQDIGSRSYTYITTLALAMEAAAENHVAFVVLDRPNPLGGVRMEGRQLDLKFRSSVGHLPVPYVHGLTVGELAQMINGEHWLKDGVTCDLQVIPMHGWKRSLWWDQTGLVWIPTSPHVPRPETAAFYAATGIMGELGVISEGVGYTLPFELVGMPEIEPQKLADELNRRHLPGVFFRPMFFQPYYGRYTKQTCGGVQIYLTDRDRAELTPIQFHVMDAVRTLHPDIRLFGAKRDGMFDKVCGTDEVRKLFEEGRPIGEILSTWSQGVEEFRAQRAKYLLYE
jgi:uncharacterized protein YbbC (DUF1343 family)